MRRRGRAVPLLLADVPGTDCWDASPEAVADAVHRLATAQARIEQPPHGIPDRRPEVLAAAVRDLLDGSVGVELSPEELRATRSLQRRWEMLADCGLPDNIEPSERVYHLGDPAAAIRHALACTRTRDGA